MSGADAAGDPRTARLTHLDEAGRAHMVDVGAKAVTEREAVAEARVRMLPATAALLAGGELAKGDALAVARLAGIQAAKRTWELIPLCHQVALSGIDLDVRVDVEAGVAVLRAAARTTDRTGVEMEAMVAASTAALTLYDMVKGVERGVVVEEVALVRKSGGRSGVWVRG